MRVISGNEPEEFMDDLRIKNKDWKFVFNGKAIKGDVESIRGFHDPDGFRKEFKEVKKIREAKTFEAQPIYRVLSDRGIYFFGGSKSYKQWNPCPSLFGKALFYPYKTNCY